MKESGNRKGMYNNDVYYMLFGFLLFVVVELRRYFFDVVLFNLSYGISKRQTK